MDVPRKENQAEPTKALDADTASMAANLADASRNPNGAVKASGKSWGDKYKAGTLHFIRDDLVNYGINFAISALFTYKVDRWPPTKKFFENAVDWIAKKGTKVGVPHAVGEFIGDFFTKTQLLLCGGHVLLPFMKYTHDHKQALEFTIGHRLDQFQEAMGRGTEASRLKLEEHKVVRDIMRAKPKHLSENEKAILAKNNIGENLQFNERRSSWNHVLRARLGGMAATTTLSILLGYSNSTKKGHWHNFKEDYGKPAGEIIGDKVLKKIPLAGPKIADPHALGYLTFTELIYTLVSKLGFDRIEKKQFKKQLASERQQAASDLKADEKNLTKIEPEIDTSGGKSFTASPGIQNASLSSRKKLIADGEKDFRQREMSKPIETSAALS